jgi:hypothetical protein
VYVWILVLVIQYAKSMHLHHTFPRHLINGMIFGDKKFTEYKMCVLIFSTTLSFLILRTIQPDIITNVHRCSCELPIFCQILIKLEIFLTDIWKILKYQMSQKSVQLELSCSMQTDEQMNRHDEDNSHFCNFPNVPNK